MSVERNKASVQRMLDAFTKEGGPDLPVIYGELAEDVKFDHLSPPTKAQEAGVPWLVPRTGIQGAEEFFGLLAEGYKISMFNVKRLLAAEDTVLVFVEEKATISKTGKEMHHNILLQFTFNDAGKVQAFDHWMDTALHVWANTP